MADVDALGESFRTGDKTAVVSDSGGYSSIDVGPVVLVAGARVVLADDAGRPARPCPPPQPRARDIG